MSSYLSTKFSHFPFGVWIHHFVVTVGTFFQFSEYIISMVLVRPCYRVRYTEGSGVPFVQLKPSSEQYVRCRRRRSLCSSGNETPLDTTTYIKVRAILLLLPVHRRHRHFHHDRINRRTKVSQSSLLSTSDTSRCVHWMCQRIVDTKWRCEKSEFLPTEIGRSESKDSLLNFSIR